MKKLLLCLALATVGTSISSRAQFLTQDFEGSSTSLPSGWVNNTTGGGNGWQIHSGGDLVMYATVPSHTNFAYVDDYHTHNNNPSKLTTTTFSMAASSGPAYVVFDQWFPQYRITSTGRKETAWIEMSTNGGSSFSFLDSIRASGSYWVTKGVMIPTTTSATCVLRFCYSDNRGSSATDTGGIIGVALDNIKVYNPPSSSIEYVAVTPRAGDPSSDYNVVSTGSFNFGGTVYNWGTTTLTSFNASYKVASGSWVSGSVTGVSIAPFTSGTFTCTTPYNTPTTVSTQNATVAVNVTGDPDLTDDTLSTAVNAVSSFPTKRPFFEEPTGTWCGWCVRGIVYMDSIWKAKKGLVSVISVHNSDPMEADNASSTKYDALMGTMISGYPSLVVDRIATGDPSQVFSYFGVLSTWYGFADVKAIASPVSGGSFTVTGKVTPTTNLSGDYRMELIVTEDRVHGTASGWEQHNYYNGGGSGAMQNAEYNFATLPGTIPATQMYYDYVARTTQPADLSANPNGVSGSLPGTMTSGTTYSWTSAPVTVASNWVSNKLRGVIALIDNNSSSYTYGMVLNSASTIWYVGVENVEAGIRGGRIFPNPATEQANLIFDLDNSDKVTISVYDAVGRLVSSNTEEMTAGEQHVTIPVANYAAGVYNVVIATANGSVSERFSVTR